MSTADTSNTVAAELANRVSATTANVAILGMGYVGLPLAAAVHEAGFPVMGFDVDRSKIEHLRAGTAYLKHLGSACVKTLAQSERFTATDDPADLAIADIVILCVPTPLGPHREPDLTFVEASTRLAAATLRTGQLVILESTTWPGTTREVMLPILEETGLVHGSDFFLAYSPEREDPGRKNTTTQSIPKLVGGLDATAGELAEAFYDLVIDHVHRVATAEVAEAAKLLENIYRSVNIALVNEMKIILDRLDIDVWDVVAAAATKPFGFQAFYPGPGLGGHCIPIDPFYLAWKAREAGVTTRFIELAGEINHRMPQHVVDRLAEALNDDGKPLRGSQILLLGIAYKPDVDDTREAPAAKIIEILRNQGAEISYHDPHCPTFPEMREYDIDLSSTPLDASTLSSTDAVLIITDHKAIDWTLVGQKASLVVDTRNAMAGVENTRARIVKA
ncbi:MAG: nucleotide sugar dehydrogenase [Pirellulaceae bacterium]|jgi:UDP-N-acetyl-D-glucosamine dehydrogenase|nr:nucleotide sugar dehydrogenase [Pirellulaceae bacterium]